MGRQELIELRKVSKVFPGVTALKEVDFVVKRGAVNGLVGENGAGKTTLLNIINGTIHRSSGDLLVDGKGYHHFTGALAKSLGILTVTQHVQLFPELSIAENLCFNEVSGKSGLVSYRHFNDKARDIFSKYSLGYAPTAKLKDLNYVDQQMVEILKVVFSKNRRVIVLDEPTAPLPISDIELLFQFIRKLREEGVTFIFVSHKIDEVMKICDNVAVLRDGRKVLHEETRNLENVNVLINAMVGRDVEIFPPKESLRKNEVAMRVKDLKKEPLLRSVSFDVYKGEILGVAGLRGSGNTLLSRVLAGVETAEAGSIEIANRAVRYRTPARSRKHGVGFLPNDRFKYGILPIRPVRENVSIGFLKRVSNIFGYVSSRKERRIVAGSIKSLEVKTPNMEVPVLSLSGGNQQKCVLARLVEGDCRVFVMEEPTFGVDIQVKREIHRIMFDMVKGGSSIILVGDDLLELTKMCDRILVLVDGRITKEFAFGEIDNIKLAETVAGKDE